MNGTLARRYLPPELAVLLILGFLLRLGVYFYVPNIHYPDEIYQTLEPAHRLVFGTGLMTWEWVVGIRSWLLPGFFAGLMEIGRLFGSDPAIINLPIVLFMAATACAPIACGYFWGKRFFGRSGGLIAGAVLAVWVDLVYMAPHTLTEIVAAYTLIVALYLGDSMRREGVDPRRRLILSGFMVGLTFALRFHLGPALAVAALGICGVGSWARWRTFLAAASVPVLCLGLLDWMTLGAPFQSIILNYQLNIEFHIASSWSVEPFSTLLLLPFAIWGVGAGFVFFIALIGARRLPLLLFVAATIFLTHSFIAHKEYRFIFPALPLLFALAGIGTAEIVQAILTHHPAARHLRNGLTAGVVILWGAISLAIAHSAIFNGPWTRARADVAAFRYIAENLPETCGVALYDVNWLHAPGQAWLRPNVPIYRTDLMRLVSDAPDFDVILASQRMPMPDAGFNEVACFEGDRNAEGISTIHHCVWKRSGGCTTGTASPPPEFWPPHFHPRRRLDQDAPPGGSGDHGG